jgi:glycosyltransferase involved in cell wall biosynthesis
MAIPVEDGGGGLPEVVAIIQVYNEEDVFEAVLKHLTEQGIGVYVMDDWSTDETLAIAQSFVGKGVVGIEQFPFEGRSEQFLYEPALQRKAVLAKELATRGARWVIHYDADELRESPWPGVSLREGLLRAESEGFNAVDHMLLEFVPVDETWRRGLSPAEHFRYFRYMDTRANSRHVKAWIQGEALVDLVTHAGHAVEFPGRRVHPLPFLIRHYSIRSTAQARKKIFQDRLPRYEPELVDRGLHLHYRGAAEKEHFLGTPEDPGVQVYSQESLQRALLAERYAATSAAAENRILELERELRLAQAQVAHYTALHQKLRYRMADRFNAALKWTGIHKFIKRLLSHG